MKTVDVPHFISRGVYQNDLIENGHKESVLTGKRGNLTEHTMTCRKKSRESLYRKLKTLGIFPGKIRKKDGTAYIGWVKDGEAVRLILVR